ncbi:hypothetical protein TK90_2734 (plasmid) [Thioalkalivibrio sp. K90mix]|uniref:hypothetical protein n=1 Tax=Thioalkalivibrio sp. (strain K90mix) TaxID=396595 RepID=UPI000195A55D|nr:hypothetical protein [Thioalkalivibrio sp. K90mix]ADC73220.1 hypothetical protein TK90_2734 [Thioalkalivibrio sp. K90mix]
MEQRILYFARQEGMEITTTAELAIETRHSDESDEALLQRLIRGLTRWAIETDEGRKEWAMSVEDFNVGDLANAAGSEQVERFLSQEGISIVRVDTADCSSRFDFDTVLVDADAMSEENAA